MLIPPIGQVLSSSAALVAIADERIYRHGRAPQQPNQSPIGQPYVTWFIVSNVPENNLSDPPPTDRCTVQIDCWARNDTQVVALATAVRDVMERYVHMTGVPIDTFENDSKLYRMGLQFDWWINRGDTPFTPLPDDLMVLVGEGEPDESMGGSGDAFIDVDSGDVFSAT